MLSTKLFRFVRTPYILVAALTVCGLQMYAQPLRLTRANLERMRSHQASQPQNAVPDAQASGTYITIIIPGSSFLSVDGINPKGDIVGGYFDTNNIWQNFLLSNGAVTNINPPGSAPFGGAGGWLATTIGINPQGDIVASYSNAVGGPALGFLLSHGQYTAISPPGAGCGGTLPAGINAQGDIVGWYFIPDCSTHGFLLSKGTYTDIDVPASLGASPGTTVAMGINEGGDIVGFYGDGVGNVHGFLLSHGSFSTVDVPGSVATYPFGISVQGDIVGVACCGSTGGFLSQGTVTAINFPESGGSPNTVAFGINPKGDIVGTDFVNGFLLTKH